MDREPGEGVLSIWWFYGAIACVAVAVILSADGLTERVSGFFYRLNSTEWVAPDGNVYTVAGEGGECEKEYEAVEYLADQLNRSEPDESPGFVPIKLYSDPKAECVVARRIDDRGSMVEVVVERDRVERDLQEQE